MSVSFLFDNKLARRLFESKKPQREKHHQAEQPLDESDENEETELFEDAESSECDDPHDREILSSLETANLFDYSHCVSDRNLESTAFVYVPCAGGNRVIKKTSLAWYCEMSVRGLSNDRTLRVMQTASFSDRQKAIVKQVGCQRVTIGDWCVFDSVTGNERFLGRVLSFSYINSPKKSFSLYEWEKESVKSKPLEALCVWYEFDGGSADNFTGKLLPTEQFCPGFHSCDYYVCSVPPPRFIVNDGNTELFLSGATVDQLSKFLRNIQK